MSILEKHWVRRVQSALQETGEIPLWGSPPPFPWETCNTYLKKSLNLEQFSIEVHKTEWHAEGEILSGIGESPFVLGIELPPLAGTVYWIMSTDDIAKMTTDALSPQHLTKSFSDPRFQEGFYRYLAVEILHTFDQMRAFGDLSVKFSSSSSLPKKGALCLDIRIKCNQHTMWGRLACPEPFHASYKSYFALEQPSLLSSPLADEVEVTTRLEIGNTALSLEQWKRANVGDLLLLDRCSYDPKTQKGSATLILEKTPLFRTRLRQDNIKIVDYAYYYEENTMVEDSISGDENEGSKEEEFIEGEEQAFSEGDLEENGNHLWSTKNDEDASLEKMVSAHDVPVIITVEVARVRMTIGKLLQLKPGNTLEMSAHPEQGVDLCINGKRIAKAELVKIGEALGVKILQIGNH